MGNNDHGLDIFFRPKSIAIIGASAEKGKVGNDVLMNVKNSFKGKIFPINPAGGQIEGIEAYKSVLDIPGSVDLGIVIVPAKFVLTVVDECGKKGCQNIIVISAGFKEVGVAGKELEEKLVGLIKKYNLNLLGPNCLGFISPRLPLNASFADDFDLPGNIAFISQSGAMGVAFLDKAIAQRLGLGYFLSVGNKAGIDEIALLDYFEKDEKIKVILIYAEEIKNGREFMAKAAKISRQKPVIVLKAGKTAAGQKAVSSHTGSLAGSAQAYTTAFVQSGLIEANGPEEFFNLAKGFSLQPLPSGNAIAIVTNAGGPGILTTDLLPEYGLKLAELTEQTKATLKASLPPAASVHNPVDILGDGKAERYAGAVQAVSRDENVNAILVLLTPQKMTEVEKTAELIGQIAENLDKPVVLCFMGEKNITKAYEVFAKNSLPYFDWPQVAVSTLSRMHNYYNYKKSALTKDQPRDLSAYKASKKVSLIMKKDRLTETDCRDLLLPLKFPLHKAGLAKTEKEALVIAKKIGYPVALKVVSPDIVHKSDMGGVKIGLKTPQELKAGLADMKKTLAKTAKGAKIEGFLVGEMVKGLEIILGVKQDPQFGALVMVGAGGIYTEIFKDVAFGIAPFSLATARQMISNLKIHKMFLGARGQKPLDLEAVAELLVRLGDLAWQFPEISEIDFNPVMVKEKGKGCTVVDLRFLK